MNFFREFYEDGCFVPSLNATFLVLILKKDFRPIILFEGGEGGRCISGWLRCWLID